MKIEGQLLLLMTNHEDSNGLNEYHVIFLFSKSYRNAREEHTRIHKIIQKFQSLNQESKYSKLSKLDL